MFILKAKPLSVLTFTFQAAVLSEYSFLTDLDSRYGYLDHSSAPVDAYDRQDPILMQFYVDRLNHAMKRALYCIVSMKNAPKIRDLCV